MHVYIILCATPTFGPFTNDVRPARSTHQKARFAYYNYSRMQASGERSPAPCLFRLPNVFPKISREPSAVRFFSLQNVNKILISDGLGPNRQNRAFRHDLEFVIPTSPCLRGVLKAGGCGDEDGERVPVGTGYRARLHWPGLAPGAGPAARPRSARRIVFASTKRANSSMCPPVVLTANTSPGNFPRKGNSSSATPCSSQMSFS